MPVRFDDEKMGLRLSVSDLLEAELLRSLGFGNRGGYERMWLGQAIHSRYQEQASARDPNYQREVPVTLKFPHRGWEIAVEGRVDGLWRDSAGALVIEEVKSVRRGGQLSSVVREIYQRQALLYSWMLHRLHNAPVRAELVLIEIGSHQVEREPLEVNLAAVEASIKRRLNSLIRDHQSQRQAADQRRRAAERQVFPYPALRPGQREIIAAVERTLEDREHLLLQAATGIGKTVAAVYPALRFALVHEKRIFVLTAKNLQQEMATQVLELLNSEASFQAVRLRAKAKMCANDQMLCHEEYCRFAKDYYRKLLGSDLLTRLPQQHPVLQPTDVFDAATQIEVCPFEVSLELAQQTQVTVCDYNYAFDPYVALNQFSSDQDLSDVILLIDEIHNLVGRGRDYYSPRLSASAAREAASAMAAGGASIHFELRDLCLELARLIEATADEVGAVGTDSEGAGEVLLPEDDFWALRPDFDSGFVDYLEHQRTTKTFRVDDPFVSLYFDVLRFLNAMLLKGDAFNHCAEVRAQDCSLKILCKDPSRFLGQTLNRVHSAIGLSATLSPPEFYRDLLGFDSERTSSLAIANPFPPENRRIVIDDSVATTWRQRPSNYQPIAERLAAFSDAVPGNCLALFPSYEFLSQVARRLQPARKRVLVQQPTDSDSERVAILETLRSALLGDVLLLAVAGGVFAEGVDYPGDMLRAVAVVGPCLPAVTLEQKLLEAYYQDRFEKGFEYAFVVPGMTRVVQAAGRLIRSPDDVGVIALLDRRFLAGPYCQHLPQEWLPAGGAADLTEHPAQAAASFFRGLGLTS